MGTSGLLGGGSRAWARVLLLVSWSTLVGGACSGSKTVTPNLGDGGEPAAGSVDGDGQAGPRVGNHAAGGTSAGRGGDHATGGTSAGRGGTNAAGTSSAGRGGTGGHGGAAPISGTRLGRACLTNTECQSVQETGLTCLTEASVALGNAAPPHGLCTLPCTTDDECTAHGAGAVCYAVADGASYCLEGCRLGTLEIGETKCHGRPDFACNPAGFGTTADPCQSSQDCQDGEVCQQDACNVVFSACLPACRGDIDCGVGRYCDQSFLSGVCTTKKPIGKRLGAPCTVAAADQPDEPDECLGFCQADTAVGTQGHCAATCSFARECAWDPGTQRYDGLCAFGSVLTPTDIAQGFRFLRARLQLRPAMQRSDARVRAA